MIAFTLIVLIWAYQIVGTGLGLAQSVVLTLLALWGQWLYDRRWQA